MKNNHKRIYKVCQDSRIWLLVEGFITGKQNQIIKHKLESYARRRGFDPYPGLTRFTKEKSPANKEPGKKKD